MTVTLRDARIALGRKLGGHFVGTVSVDPDIGDALSQRSVLCSTLYDSDRGSKGFSGQFVWVGKYRDSRRIRENGYRTLAYAVYIPPTTGTYLISFYGIGITPSPLAAAASTSVVETAIQSISGLASATVSASGNAYVIALPDIVDTEVSAGTLIAQGGVGALEANRAFTKALRYGDEFELSSKLPVDDSDSMLGLNTIINMALRRMWIIDRFPITPGHNARGVQTLFGLSGFDWLQSPKQMIAVYNPAQWTLDGAFTPPVSGTYTITLNMFNTSYTTAAINYTATASQIQTALLAVATNLPITVSGTGPFTIELTPTFYASPSFSVSSGTIVNTLTMITSPSRSSNQWKFQWDGEAPYLDDYFGQEGYSFYIEAYRPAYSWVSPQASYGTTGSVWASSNVGLVNDYDQVAVDQDDLAAIAYYIACKQLSLTGPASETLYWQTETARAAAVANAIKTFDLPFEDKPRGGMVDFNSGWGNKGFWSRYTGGF